MYINQYGIVEEMISIRPWVVIFWTYAKIDKTLNRKTGITCFIHICFELGRKVILQIHMNLRFFMGKAYFN